MLKAREALSLLLEKARPLEETQSISVAETLGRILASDIHSAIDVPQMDNSAMDGFAVSSTSAKTLFEVSQRIAAGTSPVPLKEGTAARIFTGAPLPEGADSVVMQEDCKTSEGCVEILKNPVSGMNVRYAGEDIEKGSLVLTKGVKIRPQEMGLIASVGAGKVNVYRRLKVAVFFTGDELVEPGNCLQKGQIYNSNRYALIGCLRSLGMDIVDLGTVADNFDDTVRALRKAASSSDLVLTCGGVSVGEEDHVKAALESIGKLDMWKVAVKPGKPFAFGSIEEVPFIGLPGNPVSAFLMFCLFARPFLLKMQGAAEVDIPRRKARAGFSFRTFGRREWLRARMENSNAVLFPKQGSGVMTSLSWAEGLVEIPESADISPGDEVDYLSFSDIL